MDDLAPLSSATPHVQTGDPLTEYYRLGRAPIRWTTSEGRRRAYHGAPTAQLRKCAVAPPTSIAGEGGRCAQSRMGARDSPTTLNGGSIPFMYAQERQSRTNICRWGLP